MLRWRLVSNLGVLGHFSPWYFVGIGDIRTIWRKFNFLCQNVLTFSIYILFTKRIETLWSRDISSVPGMRKF